MGKKVDAEDNPFTTLTTGKDAVQLYSRQLEVERACGDGHPDQLQADQGYAMRLVIANGFLGIIEAIEGATLNIYDLPE